ncbi:MAG: hypothetical protein R6V04_12165 [bacterium]
MEIKIKKTTKRILISIILIIAIIFSSLDYTSKCFDFIYNKLNIKSNEVYINESLEKSLITFGVISAIKIGLAVIEGSEIGIGLGFEAGDIVQAAYDYVNFAWKAVLLSSTVLLCTKYVLLTISYIDQWLIALTLVSILLFLCSKWFFTQKRFLFHLLQDISNYFIFISLGVLIIIPASISGGRFLSKKITAPSVQEAEKNLSVFRKAYFPDIEEDNKNIWSEVKKIKTRVSQVIKFLTHKTSEFSLWLLKIVAAYFFDTIIFPLLMLVFLIWFPKVLMKNYFRYKGSQ